MGHRFRIYNLAIRSLRLVAVLLAMKIAIHTTRMEFLETNTLTGSAIAGAIFICGFLLSGLVADFKEADRIPAEIRASLENILEEASMLSKRVRRYSPTSVIEKSRDIVRQFVEGVSHGSGHADLFLCLSTVGSLGSEIATMERIGLAANAAVRLKNEQGSMRRHILRALHIQRTSFIPSSKVLAESIVALVILLLLFVRTEGSPESVLLFGFICYMFIYLTSLIRELDQPFREGDASLDDVSLYLLHDLERRLTTELTQVRRHRRSGQRRLTLPKTA